MSVQNDYIQKQWLTKYEYKSREGKTLNLIKVKIIFGLDKQTRILNYKFEYLKR